MMKEQEVKNFPKEKSEFLLPGPAGSLEVATTFPKENGKAMVGIICHPNPQEGGTMNIDILTSLKEGDSYD